MKKTLVVTMAFGLALAGGAAQAGVVTFTYSTAYTGATPTSTPPWLTATFTDISGGVELKLQANGLPEGAFVSKWLFNFDPSLDPSFVPIQTGGVPMAGWAIDPDRLNGGGPKFDLAINFPTANDPGSDRFDGWDTATFQLSWVSYGGPPIEPLAPLSSLFSPASPLILAQSFNFPTGGGEGVFSGAHIQGLAGEDSGWIGTYVPEQPIPEPGTLLLVGSGILGLARFGRRRR